jgi:plasmid stability protein
VGHLHVRDLDDDLHRAVRIEAIERDESVKAFVTRALERELERSRKKRGADPRRTR